MIQFLLGKYQSKKELIKFFFFTYLDKGISFVLPLSILFVIKDNSAYNTVEVIFSYASIALTVVELGFTNYLFFGFKKASDKNVFLAESQIFFKISLLFYSISSMLIALLLSSTAFTLLFILIAVRTLFTFYVSFYSNVFRLKDRPSSIYTITIVTNLTSFLFLLLAHFFLWKEAASYFFLPSALFLLGISVHFLIKEISLFNFDRFKKFIAESMIFAWPIMLNSLLMNFMNNYAKIYAYGNLSQQEMTEIAYLMRIGMLIQLTHAAFSAFYSKSLFMDAKEKFNMRIFKQYNATLLFSVFMVVLIILFTNTFLGSFIKISLALSSFLFLFYILIWCYIGYLELYFGVLNANRKTLYYSVISSIFYIFLVRYFDNIGLLQLSVFMVATGLLNLAMVIYGLARLRVFTHEIG